MRSPSDASPPNASADNAFAFGVAALLGLAGTVPSGPPERAWPSGPPPGKSVKMPAWKSVSHGSAAKEPVSLVGPLMGFSARIEVTPEQITNAALYLRKRLPKRYRHDSDESRVVMFEKQCSVLANA